MERFIAKVRAAYARAKTWVIEKPGSAVSWLVVGWALAGVFALIALVS